MLRRRFLKGIVAHTAVPKLPVTLGATSLVTFQTDPAFAEKIPEIELVKAFSKLKKLLTWVDWAEEGVPKMNDGKIPPPPPGPCSDDLSVPLESFTTDVDQIDVSIALPSISYDDLPGDTLRETRALLAAKFFELQGATGLFRRLDLLENQVVQKRQALNARLTALQILSDALLHLATIPLPATYHAAVSCWATLEITYQQRFLSAITALDRLERRSKKEKTDKISDIQGIVSEHQNFLSLEIVQLNAEEDIQAQLESEYEESLAELDAAKDENSNLNRELKDAETRLTAYRLDIQNLGQENANLSGRISTLNANISSWRSDLKDRYSYCPNSKTYSVCTHKEEKSKWDRRQRNLRDQIKRAKDSISRARKAISNNKILIERFEAELAEWAVRRDQIKAKLAESDGIVSALEVETKEKLANLNKRKFTSPVDLLRNASEQESYSLSQLSF